MESLPDTDMSRQEEEEEEEEDSSADKSAKQARLDKFKLLKRRLTASQSANRSAVHQESTTRKTSIKESARLDRKRKQAEMLGSAAEALETGEDLERKRNWEYNIDDVEKWDKKMKRKDTRAQFEFTNADDMARRKYRSNVEGMKPDLAAYDIQRSAAHATGGSSTDVVTGSSSSSSLVLSSGLSAAEDLYRDANTLSYGDHKPSDDAVDRVIQFINLDIDKRLKHSRNRKEDDGDITYINEKNKHFNKKLERVFNKYTEDIRNNFERGTAL